MPRFAYAFHSDVPAEHAQLLQLIAKTSFFLLRSRLFLYCEYLAFAALNIFGVWSAVACYIQLDADAATKLVFGATPLLYINVSALLCLLPIHATRREIGWLKDKLRYLRFKHEFEPLFWR